VRSEREDKTNDSDRLARVRDAAITMKRRKQAGMILATPILEPYVE
jgi:hypothetical protein